jgi:putative tryptophan/tyrosine transport system substrate-binding protein
MISIPRRKLIALGGMAGLAALAGGDGGGARAAAPERVFRIFMVLGRGESSNETGFKDYLARRGIRAEYTVRNPAGDAGKIADAVREIRETRPDLIYTWGTPQTRGVVGAWDAPDPQNFVRDIPVVFNFVANPIDARIVRALDRPGGNVTGTVHIAPVAVQVNTILAYRPIKTLGTVFNPAERNAALAVADLREECERRGLRLLEFPLPLVAGKPDAAAIPDLIAHCKEQGAEMLYVGPDTFVAGINYKITGQAALAVRLPTFSVTELIVRSDRGMLALASSTYGIGRFTGFKAAQILLDDKAPGDIPVETLRRFSVIINMSTVKELAFYPPIGLLNFAEVVGA